MQTTTFYQLVAHRVSKGFNERESIELLVEELRQLTGDNLVNALVYQGFATEAQAHRIVKAGK